jgi:hypothetical protein
MSSDLNDLLRDWPHEPGRIKVRRILGGDWKPKIQLRIDLGAIQMEATGRPDGARPHGFESLLIYHLCLAQKKEAAHEQYVLSAGEVSEFQLESIQYYHRYISLFQLNDFPGVICDTQHNIDIYDFVRRHRTANKCESPLEQFRSYALMMNTRAHAAIELENGDIPAAVREIELGKRKITEAFSGAENPETVDRNRELAFLNEWLEKIQAG